MKKIIFISLFSFFLQLLNADFKNEALLKAKSYQAVITRDIWGVPHIEGKRDADVAFGIAYAHAQDDIQNLVSNMSLYRAQMGLKDGFEGLVTDYLIKALEIRERVESRYQLDLSPEVRKVIEAYVHGLNYWAAINPNNEYNKHFPITKEDVVVGFALQNLFFSGVISSIEKLQTDKDVENKQIASNLKSSLLDWQDLVLGSNAFSANPNKTGDGSTRLIINSHQPLEGPLAWYEAHVKSEEGWNMMGGVFPGSPFIFVGFNENLGWGFTVNKPDLSDTFILKINPEDDTEYLLDDEWVPFRVKNLKLPVKIWGPFWWTFNREAKYSIHGPVLETDHGTYAIRFSGMEDIKQVEQWYKLNKAKTKEEWLASMNLRSIVSFNAVYADKKSNIIFLHNSSSPKRKENLDWSKPVDGTRSSLVWNELIPLENIPLIINPKSGWLISTNQDPFKVTSIESRLSPSDYSPTLGLQTRMTNRANRGLELFSETKFTSEKRFKEIKFDNSYSKNSRAYKYLKQIFDMDFKEEILIKGQKLLKDWDLKTDFNSRAASLGVCVISPEWLSEQGQRPAPPVENVFRDCIEQIYKVFGRIDPLWSERNFLVRGNKKISVQGGPDTLRAIYGREQKEGYLKAQGGDGLYIYVEWDKEGNLKSESVHQYGSATQDSSSRHYDDQMELYTSEKFKNTFFYTFSDKENTESRITIPLQEDS